jgi:hypothetical protein
MLISGISMAVVFLLAMLGLVTGRMAMVWLRYRGTRLITCPANRRPAEVKVRALHVAASSLLRPEHLQLVDCSRWPAEAGCGQQCLSQIEAAPEGCLVRHIVTQWYADKVCASCGEPFDNAGSMALKAALQTADKVTVEWKQIPVDELPERLKTALPVCFSCHVAGTLVREHPELAIDRARRTFVQEHRAS